MRIGLDIDDTICNTKDLQKIYWKEYILNNPNSEYSDELPIEINSFGIPYINKFWDTYRSKLFSPSIKENASLVIKEFSDKGFEFFIVTSRPPKFYDDLNGRIKEWLEKENIYVKDIYTGVFDKGQFIVDNNIDLLIDDDIRHIDRCHELGKDAILFDDDMTWDRVREILKKYL